jgi:hypothetical protein
VESLVTHGSFVRPLLACTAVLVVAACGIRTLRTAPSEPARSSVGRPVYVGSVHLRPDSGTITARWDIQLTPRSGQPDSVVFLLNPGLAITHATGPRIAQVQDTVLGDWRRITVHHRGGTGSVAIAIEYRGRLRLPGDSINSLNSHWVELGLDSHWLPVVASYDELITGSVRVFLPGSWQLASGGSTRREGDAWVVEQSVPLLDVAFSAAPAMRVTTAGRASVYDVHSPDSVVGRVTSTAEGCVTHLDATYGGLVPLPPLRIVLAPRNGPGYARKNYIVITPSANISPRGLTRFICHEVAHFWATGAVPSGADNWINEGFAEYVSGRAIRALVGQAAYDSTVGDWSRVAEGQPAIWTGPTGRRPGPRVSYAKAPHLLHRLEARIGRRTMDTFMRRFMNEPVRSTPAVVELLRAVAGDGHAAWFREELAR